MIKMSSLQLWVWLSSISGMGAVTTGRVLEHFGSPEEVYSAGAAEYSRVEGVKHSDIKQLINKDLAEANKILSSCVKTGCRIITLHDAEYPERLRNTYNPPIILYLRGKMPVIDEEAAVALVGTRNCTPYGKTAAENIGYHLAKHGLLVVTGLAKGIDAAAARGALKGGGRVVGVIGTGLDIIYPRENKALFEEVARDGAILSEYPPGTTAKPGHFPARNRILSGLSLGVAVLEAPKKSGALITATRALEQGRDVFALPGNIDAKNSEGSNALLREGAIPLLSGENIVEEYAQLYPDKIKTANRSTKINVALDTGAAQQLSIDDQSGVKAENGTDAAAIGVKKTGAADELENKEIDNATEVDYIDNELLAERNGVPPMLQSEFPAGLPERAVISRESAEELVSRLDGDERAVAEAIGTSAMLADAIIAASNLPASQTLAALTMLEINGHVGRSSAGYYTLLNPDH